MKADSQDVLTEALTQLQSELEQFDGVQKALKGAHERLMDAEKEWRSLTVEQQLTAADLVQATKAAIEATQAVTGQASALTAALIPLAKAVENVNFPLRLDKIDLAVTTHSSSLASFQTASNRRFDDLERADKNAFAAIAAVKTRVALFGWFTVVLLLLNTVAFVALSVFLKLGK